LGRTIPSFRLASVDEENEWRQFREQLDKSDRKVFDNMLAISHLYNSACSSCCRYIKIQPIFMSIIFHHYKEISKLCEELQKE
jgi:hypothetical protein